MIGINKQWYDLYEFKYFRTKIYNCLEMYSYCIGLILIWFSSIFLFFIQFITKSHSKHYQFIQSDHQGLECKVLFPSCTLFSQQFFFFLHCVIYVLNIVLCFVNCVYRVEILFHILFNNSHSFIRIVCQFTWPITS